MVADKTVTDPQIPLRVGNPYQELCDSGHRYWKEQGVESRCPHCLLIGLTSARKQLAELNVEEVTNMLEEKSTLTALLNWANLKELSINCGGSNRWTIISRKHNSVLASKPRGELHEALKEAKIQWEHNDYDNK